MDFMNAVEEISENIQNYYGQERLLVIILFCVLLAYLYSPAIKRLILYPTLLIVFVIMNPILYQLVFSRVIYWRLLWVIPGTCIIAYIICQLVKTSRTPVKKFFVFVCLCLFIALSGSNVYNNVKFKKTQNLEKIDAGVKEVGDIILKNCDQPKCLLRSKYLSQIRQYSPDIELLYGRNVYNNYITGASAEHRKAADEMEKKNPDYPFILEEFKKGNCNIIVVRSRTPITDELLTRYRLYEIARIDQSIIYKKREKN